MHKGAIVSQEDSWPKLNGSNCKIAITKNQIFGVRQNYSYRFLGTRFHFVYLQLETAFHWYMPSQVVSAFSMAISLISVFGFESVDIL